MTQQINSWIRTQPSPKSDPSQRATGNQDKVKDHPRNRIYHGLARVRATTMRDKVNDSPLIHIERPIPTSELGRASAFYGTVFQMSEIGASGTSRTLTDGRHRIYLLAADLATGRPSLQNFHHVAFIGPSFQDLNERISLYSGLHGGQHQVTGGEVIPGTNIGQFYVRDPGGNNVEILIPQDRATSQATTLHHLSMSTHELEASLQAMRLAAPSTREIQRPPFRSTGVWLEDATKLQYHLLESSRPVATSDVWVFKTPPAV
jgi:catechol 2,3-dioxygenase-like lactoylglutathione lyase family enzyme